MTTTTTAPARERIAELVDAGDFRALFIEELGWSNPDRPLRTITVEDDTYTLTQVAGHKGLRVWQCEQLPPRRTQRAIDAELGRENAERLLVFTDGTRQEWRWPRKGQTGGVSAKLLVHPHTVGQRNDALTTRLGAIALNFTKDVPLVELLARMRAAFDAESETASAHAARLMNSLYEELEASEVSEHDATLLLARLLFLLFADDSDMWVGRPDLFARYLEDHTTAETLHTDLDDLFLTLDTPERERGLLADSPLGVFRHVGGLFAAKESQTVLPPLRAGFRDGLLEACEFDWSNISPAVFGSMFQTVKDKDARRSGGEHYTTKENILKTLGPLFLDELRERLDAAWDDKAQLTRLHNDLARLQILDPACGCGNFLIVAYQELRSLELEILKQRRALDDRDGIRTGRNLSQMTLDISEHLKVRLNQFHGFEIDEWPARIAGVAMLLVDHIANQAVAEEFGTAPIRLPIRIQPEITNDNALRLDWRSKLEPSDDVIIVGNPPFVGRKYRTKEQVADMRLVWGKLYNVNLDYVTTWYLKAVKFFGECKGRWAFVSTNSVSQGEPVARLWGAILDAGWRCRFAHRSFGWTTEAKDGAAVHVSIVGFDRSKAPKPLLVTYPHGPLSEGVSEHVTNINPYLVEAPNVLIKRRSTPLNPQMPPAVLGSMPNDDGALIVEPKDYWHVNADPIAAQYLRPFVGAQELLYGDERWCLWLVDSTSAERRASPVLRERLARCQEARERSKNPDTVEMAESPHLFWHIAQPATDYLAIPSTVTETRAYTTPAYFTPNIVSSNANYVASDPDGFAFAVLSSSMFMTWMRTISGRLKSDLRFSGSFSYNAFPLPRLDDSAVAALKDAAGVLLTARHAHIDLSLAKLYTPGKIPADLQAAHDAVDAVIDPLYGLGTTSSDEDRRKALFGAYVRLTAPRTGSA